MQTRIDTHIIAMLLYQSWTYHQFWFISDITKHKNVCTQDFVKWKKKTKYRNRGVWKFLKSEIGARPQWTKNTFVSIPADITVFINWFSSIERLCNNLHIIPKAWVTAGIFSKKVINADFSSKRWHIPKTKKADCRPGILS